MDKISIRGLNKAALLTALFNNSRQQGMGFMHSEGRGAMTEAEASEILKTESYFDYLRGRVMKIDIGGDDVYPGLYDRDNEDKDIANNVLGCMDDFEDGRVFRDTRWSYDALFASVEDRQMVADVQRAMQLAGDN